MRTENPDRRFALTLGTDSAQLTSARQAPADSTPTSTASLRLPAEALVRLVYGRLDEHHTPTDVQLDASICAPCGQRSQASNQQGGYPTGRPPVTRSTSAVTQLASIATQPVSLPLPRYDSSPWSGRGSISEPRPGCSCYCT